MYLWECTTITKIIDDSWNPCGFRSLSICGNTLGRIVSIGFHARSIGHELLSK